MALASGVEHGVFGGAKAEQVSHLVAELGQVLPQVVEVLHRGPVRALHLLPRGRQVTMHQAAHDLLVVLIPFLLQAPPLLKNRTIGSNRHQVRRTCWRKCLGRLEKARWNQKDGHVSYWLNLLLRALDNTPQKKVLD